MLPFSLPKPVTDGEAGGNGNGKGSGYQFLMQKFIALCDHIADIKEQTAYTEEKNEYAVKSKVFPTLAGGSFDPLPPGVHWEVERIIVRCSAATPFPLLVLNTSQISDQSTLDIIPQLLEGAEARHEDVREYVKPLIIKSGQELAVVSEVAGEAVPIRVTAVVRVIAEKPSGLAVS